VAVVHGGVRVLTPQQQRGGWSEGGVTAHIANINLGRGVDRTDVSDLMDMIESEWRTRRRRGF